MCRINIKPPISKSVAELIRKLNHLPESAVLADRQRVVGEHEINISDVEQFVRPDRRRYQRSSIYSNDKFELLLLTWMPGQISPIHNHRGSQCVLRILQGTAVETTYQVQANQRFTQFRIGFKSGATLAGEDNDIHRIENMPCADENLVTLHAYFPKLDSMDRFYIVGDRLLPT